MLTDGGLALNGLKEKRKCIHCVGRWTGYSQRKANDLRLKTSFGKSPKGRWCS